MIVLKKILITLFVCGCLLNVAAWASDAEDWQIRFRPATQQTVMVPPDLKKGEEYRLFLHAPSYLEDETSLQSWFKKEVSHLDRKLDAMLFKGEIEGISKKGVSVYYTWRRYKKTNQPWRIVFYSVLAFDKDIRKGKHRVQLVSAQMSDDLALMKRYMEYSFYISLPEGSRVDPRSKVSAGLKIPVAFKRISSRFGYRYDPFTHRKKMHSGIDFTAPRGTIVRSFRDGKITFLGRRGGYGNVVEVRHANGILSRYAHLKRFRSRLNQRVSRGDIIAEVGSTGRSTGPHLHFEILDKGSRKNPADYL